MPPLTTRDERSRFETTHGSRQSLQPAMIVDTLRIWDPDTRYPLHVISVPCKLRLALQRSQSVSKGCTQGCSCMPSTPVQPVPRAAICARIETALDALKPFIYGLVMSRSIGRPSCGRV